MNQVIINLNILNKNLAVFFLQKYYLTVWGREELLCFLFFFLIAPLGIFSSTSQQIAIASIYQ